MSSQSVWLPFELVHTNYTLSGPETAGCFVASTNGLASGNHKTEATIHGICEVIERDAHTLWHLSTMENKDGYANRSGEYIRCFMSVAYSISAGQRYEGRCLGHDERC